MTLTVTQALAQAQALGLERLDAHMLVLHVLGRPTHDRAWLLAHGSDALPASAQDALRPLLTRRARGEPMAYITGFKEFFGLSLAVDARVLDPRPDTETLVDWALEAMATWVCRPQEKPVALDLGTGSGAIALALQRHCPQWQVQGLDFSTDALAVAAANANRLQIPVQFRQGSWLSGITEPFALIVSNPPYIADGDTHLAALTHEPPQALASGADGLDDIRTIIAQAPACLLPGAWLLLEHGYDQAEPVCALLRAAGFQQVQSRHDLAGIARCSGGQWTA